ncbi:MAG TPA: porin [Phycisphaerae bacterium]|nr:porin [Phycisphaerae bacterium]
MAATLMALAVTGTAFADDAASNQDVQAELKSLRARIADLEQKEDANWMTQERASQIRSIVEETIADAKTRGQFADGDNFGYKNGFYIQTPDKNFKFQANGYLQFRYTFAQDRVTNSSSYSTQPKHGDVSGFDFRRARLLFSGNAFSPNLTYMISGDFAGDSTNNNNFQTLDIYMAYRFNDLLNIRAGSFLTPYSRLEYISSGMEFTDFPTVFYPFDPVRTLGMSVYGQPIKDHWMYELNVNNGQKSNTAGRAAEIGGKNDNRLAFYGRSEYVGGGTLADFNDEADLRKDKSGLAWEVAAAAGYESANASSNAFPGSQANNGLIGISTAPSPGFLGSYPLNGDLYRGTVDGGLKWQGFSATSAAFIQQINENTGAGITLPAGYATNGSFFELGYYGQVGYMITPKIEAVARAGELLTEGEPNKMEEYSLGLNYYMFGNNAKVQAEGMFIPSEAAYSSSQASTAINTQDLIFRLQFQLKF